MSLLDVLDKIQIGSGSSITSTKKLPIPGFAKPVISGGGGGGSTSDAASSSRERGVPERIDISSFVPQGFGNSQHPEDTPLAFQAAEVVGRAPGFIAERPISLVRELTSNDQGESVLDAIGDFGPVKFLGEVVGNISSLPGAIANSSTADVLRKGTQEGWGDGQMLQVGAGHDIVQSTLRGLPVLDLLVPELKSRTMTWAEYKAEAAQKGWTEQDILDLVEGRKATTDFGDKAMSTDPLAELGLRAASDPFNLIFGAGAALKLASGAGLLARSVRAGSMLEKPLQPSIAAMASARGIARESTWLGLANYFGQVGRGIGAVPGGARALDVAGKTLTAGSRGLTAYKKAALGITAAQVGIGAVDRATEGIRGGFLEGLFNLNREVWDNQPLSQNSAFMLFSAFHFDPSRGIGRAIQTAKAGKAKFLPSNIREDVLTALMEGDAWEGKGSRQTVLDSLGGEEQLDNLIVHTHAQIVFDRLMKNPVIRASLSHFDSLDEAILANHKLGQMIEEILVDSYKGDTFNGRQTVAQLKAWFANRSNQNQSGVEFPWDGRQAVERWVEYGAAVAPVTDIFRKRGDIVLGLVDSVMSEDLRHMGTALRVAGGPSKMVPITTVRNWLSRFPQLLDDPFWAKYLTPDFDGQAVAYGPMQGKLTKLAKKAPTARDVTREMGVAERAAAKAEFLAEDTDVLAQGRATVAVSRMRPGIARRLRLQTRRVDDVMSSRGDADVAAYETRVGEVLADSGFDVDRVEQSIGSWEGSFEPSVQIVMSSANLADLRLAAALAGRAGNQDSVVLAVTGPRVRELGLNFTGYELRVALPNATPEQLQGVASVLSDEFPGFSLNDTAGVVSVVVPGAKEEELIAAFGRLGPRLEALFPADLIGDTGIATSVHPAYVEFITKKKGEGDGSYAEVLAEARAFGDARAGLAGRVTAALAERRAAPGDASAGLGSAEAVGRQSRDARRLARDLAEPPATRVGAARLAEGKIPDAEPGYLYHATSEDALLAITQDGLRPFGSEYRSGSVQWPDGGTGRRIWYTEKPVDAVPYGDHLVRVRRADTGRVRNSYTTGEPYAGKAVRPALVEIYGADGEWYRASDWLGPKIEPDLEAAARETLPVFQRAAGSSYRDTTRDLSRQAFNLTEDQAEDVATLVEARAQAWAKATGRNADEWYETHLADIQHGGEVGELHQIADRVRGVEAATGNDEALRVLIEAPEPPILAEYDLGGSSPLEYIELADGSQFGLPGGVEALADGTFTLWDLWRMKAQGVDPNLIPASVRTQLYAKLFRSQVRTATAEDTFNRVTLAVLSPQNPLVRNEAGALGLRVRSMRDIEDLAALADQGLPDNELGAAVAELRPAYRAGGGPVTKRQLAAVARNAQLFRDHPDFFLPGDGEDLLEYSERLMAVLHGSEMKVGNFAVMLGNPVAFGRGTIDFQIVKRLVAEGRVPEELAARLRTKSGSFDAPSARSIPYRLKSGEVNPAVPAHLRDLPVDPPRGKVFVYDGDYRTLNDALAAKLAEEGITDFGLGGYQWMEWDLQRKRFEPHTAVFPGTAGLPLMEAEGLARAVKTHTAAGYFNKAKVGDVSVSLPMTRAFPAREGFFYQDVQGSAQFLEDGRALLRGFETANVSTALHEFSHVFRRELEGLDDEIIRRHFPDDSDEGFARAFERWARDGVAPTPELQGTFERFRQWLIEIYRRLKGSPIEAKVNPEVRGVFERLFATADDQSTAPFDPTPDPVTAGLRSMEDAPLGQAPVDPGEAALLEQMATRDDLAEVDVRGTFDEVAPDRGVEYARGIAEAYMSATGMRVPPRRNFKTDPDFGLRTARAYDALPSVEYTSTGPVTSVEQLDNASNALKDAPVDEATREAYQAFVDETLEQYRLIRESGIEIVPTLDDPYPDSAAMIADVNDNGQLKVFAGSAGHPLLTDEQNVMFRGVHDFFAHAAEGNQFGPRGELNAAVKHSQMYSPIARKAMLAETHGQNSYVNFSDKTVSPFEGFEDRVGTEAGPVIERVKTLPIEELLDEVERQPGLSESYTTSVALREAMEATPPTGRKIELVAEKWSEKKNHLRAEKDLIELEKEGHDVGEAMDLLDEYRAMERGDFADFEEYQDARNDAWDEFVDAIRSIEPLGDDIARSVDDLETQLRSEYARELTEEIRNRHFAEAESATPRTVAEVNKEKPGSIYADQKAALLPDEIYQEFEANYIGAGRTRGEDIQFQIDRSRAAKGEARRGEVLWAAQRDAEVSREIPLHRSLSGLDELAKAELSAFEKTLRDHYPAYTLKKSPEPAILGFGQRGDIAARYLRDRTELAESLATWGPLGKISRLIEWLTAPVRNEDMGRAARQALMNELLPRGAKPKDVDEFLSRLSNAATLNTIGPFQVRTFRNGTSLTQQAINKIAAGDPEAGISPVFSEKTIEAIGRDNFARVLDRASNRFMRTMDERARKGGKRGALARGIGNLYSAYQHTAVGDSTRLVSKTLYHWFRFVSDPRWWAMNMLEADVLGGVKYGIGATRLTGANRAEVGVPTLVHQFGPGRADAAAFERALGDGNGWLYTRRQGGYISRAFDHERPETVLQILRQMEADDPIIKDLKAIVKDEDLRSGRTVRTRGEILDEDLVEAIDRMLYSFDTKGAKATIIDEAKEILGEDETRRLLPFLQKVWEANDKTYESVVQTFHGNPNRTNLERIANSFWLYWPISYQIKATKWLVSAMTQGAFGVKTNMAGAALYAHHVEEHRQRLANDPDYVQMFEDHPTLWFLAQMLVPITPGDIGVSLSRPIRYGVGALGDGLEEATGSRLGLWGSYKSADDPVTAAGAIMSLGPVYTAELLARVGRELFKEPTENLYP